MFINERLSRYIILFAATVRQDRVYESHSGSKQAAPNSNMIGGCIQVGHVRWDAGEKSDMCRPDSTLLTLMLAYLVAVS